MRGAGMAQTVWAIMWQATAKCSNVNGDARGSAVRCHGSIGCAQPKEKKAGGPLGSHALEIFQNCVAHLGGEWIFLNSLVLQTAHTDFFIGPVEVIECQPADLSYAQTVDRQKQDDCSVANVARTICVEIGNQTLDLFPAWAFRETGH